MVAFYIFISIVFGILNIVLFFKIWGMTNDVSTMRNNMGEDVSRMRDVLERIYYSKSRDKVDSSTVFDKEENAVKANIELYSWVKEVKSNQEFQVIEIIDEETFVCVNEKHQDGIKLKRSEIEFIMN